MATITATAAQAAFQAQANTYGNRVVGDWTATGLSATASAVGLLAKLPHGAKHIRIGWSAIHTGATGAKLQFGIVRNASVTASALVALTDIAVTSRTAWAVSPISYTPDWDSYTGGPSYVQVSVGSGTVTAGFVLNYEITYDAQPS